MRGPHPGMGGRAGRPSVHSWPEPRRSEPRPAVPASLPSKAIREPPGNTKPEHNLLLNSVYYYSFLYNRKLKIKT